MKTLGKKLVVYLDKQLSDWLDSKVLEGYKKGSLIRHLMQECMSREEGVVQ